MAKAVVRKPKKKQNPLKAAKITVVDYKDTALLRKFVSDRGQDPCPPGDRRVRAGAARDRACRQERARDGPAAVLVVGSLRRRGPTWQSSS